MRATMNQEWSTARREFLRWSIAAGLGLFASDAAKTSAAPEKEGKVNVTGSEDLPIVDTHQHLWDLSRFRLPWLQGAGPINRSFTMNDYLEATAGLYGQKTVYMEVDVDPSQQIEEAEYVIDLCQRHDNTMAAAVISRRPAPPEVKAHVTR